MELDWTIIGSAATVIGIIITILSTILGFMWKSLNGKFEKIDAHILKVENDFQGWIKHLTAMQAEQSKKTDSMNARTDQLYQMFCDLLKEQRR